jgi:hypothetical protein
VLWKCERAANRWCTSNELLHSLLATEVQLSHKKWLFQNPLNILNVKFLYKSPSKSASTTENVFTSELHMWEKFFIILMGVLVGLLISWLVAWENPVSGNFLSRKHCGSPSRYVEWRTSFHIIIYERFQKIFFAEVLIQLPVFLVI